MDKKNMNTSEEDNVRETKEETYDFDELLTKKVGEFGRKQRFVSMLFNLVSHLYLFAISQFCIHSRLVSLSFVHNQNSNLPRTRKYAILSRSIKRLTVRVLRVRNMAILLKDL